MDRVSIADGRVRRPAGWWTPTVHALLRHLRSAGFTEVPEPLGLDDGMETLSWIPGESGPAGWAKVVPDDGLRAFARFLRRYHEATIGFAMSDGGHWALADWPAQPGDVICHGDFGPWNVVWRGAEPVGLVDFDFAGPGDPMLDVAYAVEYTAPFRSDEVAMRWHGFEAPPDRRHRMAVFAEAYGLPTGHMMVDAVIERQRLAISHVQQLADRNVQPQRSWVESGHLDELAARVSWSLTHRHLLQ
jgi:Phosphotransferase enzyme family